jgi:hypothetical protein
MLSKRRERFRLGSLLFSAVALAVLMLFLCLFMSAATALGDTLSSLLLAENVLGAIF